MPKLFRGGSLASIGGGGPPPDLTPEQVNAAVKLQIVNGSGQPVTSVKVGDQFQLQALLVLTAPEGVQPVSAFADVAFTTNLVAPLLNAEDAGHNWSTVAAGFIDEAGRFLYEESPPLIFSKTFTATKKGTATFTAEAADLFGHEIYVTGLNDALPWSQVTIGSTTLSIKP
jgi:hypothetical protein